MRLFSDSERISSPCTTCRYQRRAPTRVKARKTTPTARARRSCSSGGTSRGVTCTLWNAMSSRVSGQAEELAFATQAREHDGGHERRGPRLEQTVSHYMVPERQGGRHEGPDGEEREPPHAGSQERDGDHGKA